MKLLLSPFVLLLLLPPQNGTDRVINLLQSARARFQAHGSSLRPVLSPIDSLLSSIDSRAVQQAGFPVVVWTVNDPIRMKALIDLKVDGIISDRPDLLRAVAGKNNGFDVQGHRGGRNLRPENTLPAFESGLDQLIDTIETDTGVTSDLVSLISHEQFINPQTCRAADGSAYTPADQIWIKNISMAEASSRFICDKVFRGPSQQNDLTLSPVAVAFARQRKMTSPYAPTNVEQLFDFVSFYADYYRAGPGRSSSSASERAANAAKLRFNLETKITPATEASGHTVSPEVFVQVLGGIVAKHKMENRADIQSFDFRTLRLVEITFPKIRTVYLMESLSALDL